MAQQAEVGALQQQVEEAEQHLKEAKLARAQV